MKTKSIIFYFILAVGFLGSQTAMAVDSENASQELSLQVTGTALLSVTGGTRTLTLSGLTVAGAAISLVSQDSVSRLKISSLVATGETRTITASVTGDGLLNTNTSLEVQLLAPTGASLTAFENYGTEGGSITAGLQIVTDDAGSTGRTLVTGIRTCWSGTAADNGYRIKYRYQATGGGSPVSASITVTYTIAAA